MRRGDLSSSTAFGGEGLDGGCGEQAFQNGDGRVRGRRALFAPSESRGDRDAAKSLSPRIPREDLSVPYDRSLLENGDSDVLGPLPGRS